MLVAGADYAAPDLGDAIGQWSFDEDYESLTVFDATVNGNDALLVPEADPPTRFEPGVFGKALSIRVPEYALIANPPALLKPSHQYAISAWVRTDRLGRQEIVSVGNSYSLILVGETFRTFYYVGGRQWPGVSSPRDVQVNDGKWHHLVGQRTVIGTESWLELWFDGELVANEPTFATAIDYSVDSGNIGPELHFGSWAGRIDHPNPIPNGDMDEVWVFDRPLSPSEIYTLWVGNTLGPVVSCIGFEPPMHSGPVSVHKRRALPLKAQLVDSDGVLVTDGDIAPPVLQVIYESGISEYPIDVTTDAVAVGRGTEGNEFEFTADGNWRFNLKSTGFTAQGTYTVSMSPGDGYVIKPTCTASIIVE